MARKQLDVFVPICCFLAIFSFMVSHGMSKTNDSLHYLAAAQQFSQFGTLKMADGSPYIQFAPLYPILIALVAHKVILLHGFAMLLSIWLLIQIGRLLHLTSPWNLFLGLSFVFSYEWLYNATTVWSETLFLLFLLNSLHSYLQFRAKRSVNWLLLLGISLNLMLLQRNAGIFPWVGMCLLFLSDWRSFQSHERKQVISTLLIGAVSFMLWNGYKMLWLGNSPHQLGYEVPLDVWYNAGNTLQAIGLWILPNNIPNAMVIPILSMLLIALSVVISKKHPKFLGIWLLFASCVLPFFLIYATEGDIYRFTSIGLPFFFLAIFGVLSRFPKQKLISWAVSIWLIYPIGRVFYQFWKYGWI